MPRRWGPTHSPFTPSRKLKKELPPSFQSIQAKREDLYLVTETLKTKRTETLKYETQFGFQILLKMFGFQCKHKHQKEVTITPEKVLAYRVKQLVFPSAERMDICFLDKTRSFPEEKDGGSSWLEFPKYKRDGSGHGASPPGSHSGGAKRGAKLLH